jgi:hypothetical protein
MNHPDFGICCTCYHREKGESGCPDRYDYRVGSICSLRLFPREDGLCEKYREDYEIERKE